MSSIMKPGSEKAQIKKANKKARWTSIGLFVRRDSAD